jgi:RHS repeat-associated protein
VGANAYGYSAAGNQTSAPSRTYSYDVFNRLITATVSGVVTQYRYNGLGLRLYKGGANLSRFVYDEEGQLIGEYSNTGVMTREIVWLNDIPIAIMMPSGAATNLFYIDSDHLNTPRTITNQAKQKRWEWNSDPFGTTAANENPASLGTFTFNLRFAGQYFDKETGLHYNYFRDYNPAIGRYVQSDPIGLAGGLNTYAYVEGNPLGRADPSGLAPIELPPLQPIHSDAVYSQPGAAKSSFDFWSKQPTNDIVRSLKPGATEPLSVKPDGRIYDGNTRVKVLKERGVNVDKLPRVIVPPTRFPFIPFFICPACRFDPSLNPQCPDA